MPALNERRRAILDNFADEELARLDAADAAEKERERVEAEANQRRSAARARVVELSTQRMAAVKAAQGAAESLAKALTRVHEIAAEERRAGIEAGFVVVALDAPTIARRFGRYLSETLRSVPGASTGRYGEMGLAKFFRPESNWVTAERKISAHMTDGEHDG